MATPPVSDPRSPPDDVAWTVDEAMCRSFQHWLEIVGRKWTAAVLVAGARGARRFGEYRSRVVGISSQLLSQRLRELEERGLVERVVVPTTPVRISYRPTERGLGLIQALHPLVEWSSVHSEHLDGSG